MALNGLCVVFIPEDYYKVSVQFVTELSPFVH